MRSSRARTAPAAVGLVILFTGLNAAVFVVTRTHPAVYRRLIPEGRTIDRGEGWRCLTSLVAHRGAAHLAINTALLLVVTPFAVRRLTWPRYVAVYVVCGFAANALRYAAGGRHGGGASAAIVAVAGSAAVLDLLDRDVAPAVVASAIFACVLLGLGAAHTFSDNHVLAAGVGGAVAAGARFGRTRFWVATTAIALVGTAAMVTRMLAAQ